MPRFISESCKCEYIEIPKCACSSIKAALLKSDNLYDSGWSELDANIIHGNPRWETFSSYIPSFTFTFVRHPLSRLLSSWREKLKTGKAYLLKGDCPLLQDAPFENWVTWITSQNPLELDKHYRPQHLFLPETSVPYVGKLEFIKFDWVCIQRKTGLPNLLRLNTSTINNVVEITYQALWHTNRYFRNDFIKFNYPFLDLTKRYYTNYEYSL